VAALHRRASQWYEQNAEPSQAIRHALAAGDIERAADLVELEIPALRRSRQEATIRGWLDTIPDDVVRVRPVLAVGFIGALMAGGEFEGVEDRLQDAKLGVNNRRAAVRQAAELNLLSRTGGR
jgi:LuxR family maltose regulon positive regulatory protein